jgi:dihydroflavonol-4-reductase
MSGDNGNKPMNALVTGATGMLGSRVVFDLINAGYLVSATFRGENRKQQFQKNISFYTSQPEKYTESVQWVELDVKEYANVFDAVKGADIVFHCAAFVSFNPADREVMLETNITGTANVVNACLEASPRPMLIHVSSIAALGKEPDGGVISEKTSWVPEKKQSNYSVSKFHSEMEVWRGINEGLEAVVVNPSVIIGPGEWDKGSPSFFKNIYEGLKFYTVGGTGFVDVRDVSAAMLLLVEPENFNQAKSGRFLLNAENLTYQEFFRKIAASLNVKGPSVYASNFILALGWRLAWAYSKFTGRKVAITRESVRGSNHVALYSGEKITSMFGFQYRPIDQSVREISAMFLSDVK